MGRPALWKSIAEILTGELQAGQYACGDRLPSEALLAQRFCVNRHTVRRALADLRDAGLVRSRRGAGVFVAGRPTEYRLGARTRYTDNLRANGHRPERRILHVARRRATEEEAAALKIAKGAPVHHCECLLFSDGNPLALTRNCFPADALPGLPEALRRHRSVTAALAACGVPDYVRASTRLMAVAADATQALRLETQPGAPLLLSIAINHDAGGKPVEYGQSWFAGTRVAVTVEGG